MLPLKEIIKLFKARKSILVFFFKNLYTLNGDYMEIYKLKEELNNLKEKISKIGRSL